MKVKNLEIGTQVQVKSINPKGFWEYNAGNLGTIVGTDIHAFLDVHVQYNDGTLEWGNHKGIRRVNKGGIKAGDRVRLVEASVLGFLAGDVGTVKHVDSAITVLVQFDVPRNGFKSQEHSIPNRQGLYVNPENLEVITD